MSRTVIAWIALVALWGAMAVALVLPGALSITKHSGDALHMIAIMERLAQGQLPHLDFQTPIGILAFWPIALLVKVGLSVGQAFLISQVFLGALFGGAALAMARRRVSATFSGGLAAIVVILTMALVHGEADIAVSVSMHYNRWAWALAFIAVFSAFLPPVTGGRWEGPVLGVIMASLALMKVTYFVVFAPLVVLGMLMTGQRQALFFALLTGLLVAGALTLLLGVGYWAAYVSDLLTVASSNIRAQPGLDLAQVFTAPAYLAGTAVAFISVIVLRRGGFEVEGFLVLLLALAGTYVTYQNFGNDPQWWALLALLLVIWAVEAPVSGPKVPLTVCAGALAAMIAPSFVNMGVSPFRHVAIDQADYLPLLAGGDRHQDLLVSRVKANRIRGDIALEGYRAFNPKPGPEPTVFKGETLPDCRTEPVAGYFGTIAADLRDRGLAQGKAIFAIDILNPYWLYGDHPPLPGGTPWYYNGLPGAAEGGLVLLPSCPILTRVRGIIAEQLEDWPMTEVARTELYTLYRLESR
ncbi:MAG: hypothetical protein MK180_12575 [Rhodobacteraceae bacterium]|nr:hypothetical protein [Paracoccaceae bacterium]